MSSSASSSYQSIRSSASNSLYASLRSPPSATTAVTSSTVTVPVYAVINVMPEPQFKKLPEVSKSAAALLSPRKTVAPDVNAQLQSSFARTLSPIKAPLFSAGLKSSTTSPLSSSQEILKDVAEMKEDLIRMSAILQTDPNSTANKGFQSDSPKEAKMEDEEPYRIVEKVKQDLVKVSEILTKEAGKDGRASVARDSLDDIHFSKMHVEQPPSNWSYPPRYETVVHQAKSKSIPDRDFNLSKVVDYLVNDVGSSSFSKIHDAKHKADEAKKEGEGKEKQKRVLKPTIAVQEHKLKMPPSNMRSSVSDRELGKGTDVLFGADTVLESPDDISHEQDKSPLSDSGFETRSERTPSAPQSAEGMGPKALFQDIPVPPVITETRTEVVHVIRSYEPTEDNKKPTTENAQPAKYLDSDSKVCQGQAAPTPDQSKCYSVKVSPEEDSMGSGMRLKEETHITTTTRMVYHNPPGKDMTSERCDETMSVHDIMKAFQSGKDPSRELVGLFEHKSANEEMSQRVFEDIHSRPKVERIIEVHIEKGNKTEPTEVIIRETKNHAEKEMYYYPSSRLEEEEAEEALPGYLDSPRGNTLMSQEDDSRPSSAQLVSDDSYKKLKMLSQQSVEYNEDESSELRGESYNFAEKMLLSEKLDQSHSDTEDYLRDGSRFQSPDRSSRSESRKLAPRTEYVFRSSRNVFDRSGRMANVDNNFDKLTHLQYCSEPGSPKQSAWMHVSDEGQKVREQLAYEDRVDRTVKEAEEKLSEVSQFFRDKTEQLNDELSSPEKKSRRSGFRESRSRPSSTHSSPERSAYRNGGGGEEWSRERLRDRFTSTDRKCASLPSSPERRVILQYTDSTSQKHGDGKSQECAGDGLKPSQMSTSKVSAVRLKFEQEAQRQEPRTSQGGQTLNHPVRKLQETKLPVYQVFAGSEVPKVPDSPSGQRKCSENQSLNVPSKFQTSGKDQEEKGLFKTSENPHYGTYKPHSAKLSPSEILSSMKNSTSSNSPRQETTKKIIYTEYVVRESPNSSDGLKKNSESQIPVRKPCDIAETQKSPSLKLDACVDPVQSAGSLTPTLARTRLHSVSDSNNSSIRDTPKSPDSAESSRSHIVCNGVDGDQVEYLEQGRPTEGFKDIKPLPVYVSIQVGKQYEKETGSGQLGTYKKIVSHESRTVHESRGTFYGVKQKQSSSPQGSPEDDTLEQVTFMDSSGKSPVTPETPSSEELSLTSRTPDSVIGPMPGMPCTIPEETEEEEGRSSKDALKEKRRPALPESLIQTVDTKEKRVAYIEFPPPPPLEAEQSHAEKRGSHTSSEAETEMMEVNLQEEHDRHLLAEPVIRVQPPSPLPPGAENSDSSDDESVFHPIPVKKYTFKMKEEGGKRTKHKKPERNGSKDAGMEGVVKGEDADSDQNGNDQSITDCSIATTAEFSHDTDATEIDSLDGYDLQDEDDGLSEDPKTSSLSNDAKPSERTFSQSKLTVIEEEKCEERGNNGKTKNTTSSAKSSGEGKDYTLEGRHPDRQGFGDNCFGYQLEKELNSTFKTVATKGLDFDPWSSKGGENEGIFESKTKEEEPKPFGLSVEDKSQATTPDTTPARTPTDESTPTSEPNPFPFHEGKMFEMTRSGAIDMSKRDFVEERLQFFQIGEHSSDPKTGEKGKGGRSLGVASSQSKTGESFTVDGMLKLTDTTPDSSTAPAAASARCSPAESGSEAAQAGSEAPMCEAAVETASSCTITASKVDPKLRTPIKMGIAASITVKKDTGELSCCKADMSEGHLVPEYISLESLCSESQPSRHAELPLGAREYPAENCNNNNNLESSSVQANYIQCGSVVFNLQSSSQPTLQKASRVETLSCALSEEKSEGKHRAVAPDAKSETVKDGDVKQPRSRLPVKAAGWSFHTQGTAVGKSKPKQAVRAEVRKRREPAVAKVEPRSRIPIKDMKKSGSGAAGSWLASGQGSAQPARLLDVQLPSRPPGKDRAQLSKGTLGGAARQDKAESPSDVCKRTIQYFKGINGETQKLVDRLSDEEKKVQTEQSEEDSTSRSTSLSDASQPSQPSRSSRSGRGTRAEAGTASVRAKVATADRASGSERSRRSRRTGGKEGSQGLAGSRTPPIAEIKPSL